MFCLHEGRWWSGTQEPESNSALLKRACLFIEGRRGLQYGFNKIIVCWTTCLEKRNYFRRSLFSFNHVITQSNLQTRWKWGLETNRSFEKQVALGLSSVMELQLGSICRFFLRVWKAVLIKTRISGRGEDASEFLTLFGDSAAWDSKGENACFPIIK